MIKVSKAAAYAHECTSCHANNRENGEAFFDLSVGHDPSATMTVTLCADCLNKLNIEVDAVDDFKKPQYDPFDAESLCDDVQGILSKVDDILDILTSDKGAANYSETKIKKA